MIHYIYHCVRGFQLRVHKQREKDLSGLSRGVDRRMDVAQNLHCWQKILTTHNLELAELINNLDEEAAADIRKVLDHSKPLTVFSTVSNSHICTKCLCV